MNVIVGQRYGVNLFAGVPALWAALVFGCSSSTPESSNLTGSGGQVTTGSSGGTTTGASGGATTQAGGASTSGGVAAAVKGQPCSSASRVGGFWVEATETPSASVKTTSAAGSVEDSVNPLSVWNEVARTGDCAILRRPNLFCNPACTEGQVCSASGACVSAPKKRSVGTVTISGLPTAVTMTPTSSNDYFFVSATPIAFPGFSSGTQIGLTASGAELGLLSLNALGVAAVALTTGNLTVARNTPLALAWTPPPQGSTGTFQITLNLSSHGTDSVALECTVADTGSFEIPGSLITQLMDIETAGFPKLTVARLTGDSVAIASGCVDFVVKSTVIRDDVAIANATFCTAPGEPAECSSGNVCLENFICGTT